MELGIALAGGEKQSWNILEYEANSSLPKRASRCQLVSLWESMRQFLLHMDAIAEKVVVKAQVDVGGRGRLGVS